MPWLAIATNKWTWIAIAFGVLGVYAAVQHMGWEAAKARYVTLEAETAKLAAEAKVKNAQERARIAQNATEAISALQTSHDAIAARYERLRKSSASSSRVPTCPSAATSPGAGSGDPVKPDPIAGCLAALQWGDRELAKFRELWLLDNKNAKLP